MNKLTTTAIFALGLAAIGWVAWGFVGANSLALTMTLAIAAVYLLGCRELKRFSLATGTLSSALQSLPTPPAELAPWLSQLDATLRPAVQQRIEGERSPLPGLALTPYLVGLLVMLGMLGTFLGMVVTFKGAVFALEGSSDLVAIRAALTEPIKGLGLSFGTSVAGVAASAMLGLLASLARRERLVAVRALDNAIAHELRGHTPAQQREDTHRALVAQAQALPLIADRLQAMLDGLERRTEQLHGQLSSQQQAFHQEAGAAYEALARSVSTSLQDSLSASARAAGDTLRPIVTQAMQDIAEEARRQHQDQIAATERQLQALTAGWQAANDHAAQAWASALGDHRQAQTQMLGDLRATLNDHAQAQAQQATQQLQSLLDGQTQAQSRLEGEMQERLAAWTASLQGAAAQLVSSWQDASTQSLAQHQAVCQALESAASQIAQRATDQVTQTLNGAQALLTQSESLVRERMATEQTWLSAQAERMDQLAHVWRAELQALRDQEAAHGHAAMDRLDALQTAVAGHLAALGASLEAPMTRMLQTASEVPQAAAGVIAQLKQEMTRLSERDNVTLAERTRMLEQLDGLLRSVQDTTTRQRATVDALVQSATEVLQQAGQRFNDALGAQAGKVDDVAAHVTASAVELAALGEAFHQGVTLFGATSDKLADSLQRIEVAIGQSMARSDEQLAYYVAQAREVIDLSITSQQGIVEDLRRLHNKPAAVAAGAV